MFCLVINDSVSSPQNHNKNGSQHNNNMDTSNGVLNIPYVKLVDRAEKHRVRNKIVYIHCTIVEHEKCGICNLFIYTGLGPYL